MSRRDRQELIKAIEQERGSKLLVYITGDRRVLKLELLWMFFPLSFPIFQGWVVKRKLTSTCIAQAA